MRYARTNQSASASGEDGIFQIQTASIAAVLDGKPSKRHAETLLLSVVFAEKSC